MSDKYNGWTNWETWNAFLTAIHHHQAPASSGAFLWRFQVDGRLVGSKKKAPVSA
jgi:hypothetical protein